MNSEELKQKMEIEEKARQEKEQKIQKAWQDYQDALFKKDQAQRELRKKWNF